MITVGEIRKLLPPLRSKTQMVVLRQNTNDIKNYIAYDHKYYKADYDRIADLFDTGDIYQTCKKIWDFLKWNLPYTIESDDEQTTKSPAAILKKGAATDCKHYSLFAGGVLDALHRKYNEGWDWCYRFASYTTDTNPGHVFVVVFDGDSEIWIDPVLDGFNDKSLQPNNYTDMALYRVSGIGKAVSKPVLTVNKQIAESNFLVLLNNDILSLKVLFQSNPDIMYGPVQTYYKNNNFDFDHLVQIVTGVSPFAK